jgi:glycosyltransferase involved in cell wall biosynthesis
LLYAAHNVESRIVGGLHPRRALGRLRSARVEKLEAGVARQADLVVAVSENEAAWFASRGSTVRVIPNAVHPSDYHDPAPRPGGDPVLAFFGHLGYPPNRDAALSLIREVLPRVRADLPGARCLIAGRGPDRMLLALESDSVDVVADPQEMAPLWRRATVLVCALRWGAGSRLKLLEAAACGVPVVATAFSAEGLALRPGRDFVAGSGPDELAGAALALLLDSARASALAEQARRTMVAAHDWSLWEREIIALYEGLADHHGQERGDDDRRPDRGGAGSDEAAR